MIAVRDILARHKACHEAVEWVGTRNEKYPSRLWADCPRGDWLLWIAAHIGVDRKRVVRAACDCARLSLKYVPKGEKRPLRCIQVTEQWCQGKAPIESVIEARRAAYAAYAYAAAADAADAAAYADASAASAASAAAAAADAAYAAAYSAARARMRLACAKAVRKRIPWSVIRAALK